MKVSAILSALMATALVTIVHAAPAKSSADDGDALQRLVINYNQTTAAAIVAEYNDALYNSNRRSNAVKAAAPVVSKDILPYCVALSPTKPVRIKKSTRTNRPATSTAFEPSGSSPPITRRTNITLRLLPASGLHPARTATSFSLSGPSVRGVSGSKSLCFTCPASMGLRTLPSEGLVS